MVGVHAELPTRVLRRRLTPEEKEEQAKKMKLEENEAIVRKPREIISFIKYTGKLVYHVELIDIALVCDILLEKVKSSQEITVVGFDIEWPFNYQTGSGRTAVVQISPDLQNCYILQVSKLKNLPKSMSELLAHPNLRITGINIKNDVRKLARDFAGFDADKMIENCIDLGVLANMTVFPKQRWSLEKLVMEFLGLRINKNKKIRMSQWDLIPLSVPQQRYAAIDAYASLLLYYTLKKKEVEIQVAQEITKYK